MSSRRVWQLLSLVSGDQNECKFAQMEIEISNEVNADSSARPLLLHDYHREQFVRDMWITVSDIADLKAHGLSFSVHFGPQSE